MKKRKIVFVLTVLLLLMGLVFSGCDNLVLDEEPPDAPGTEASKEPTLTSGTETPEESAVTPGEENGENPDSPGTETPEEPALSPSGENGEGQNTPGGTDPKSIPEVVASVENLAEVLAALAENTAGTPYRITLEAVEIDNESYTTSAYYSDSNVWSRVNRTVGLGKRFVFLDLSRCSFKDNEVSSDGDFSYFSYFSPVGNNMAIIKNNQYIKGIVLPEGLKTIGQSAFTDCSYLASIVIPQSVTTIKNPVLGGPFFYCDGLTYVSVPADVAGAFFNSYMTNPEKSIVGLHVVLTGSGTIADGGLGDCEELTYVSVDETCTNYSSVDGVLFTKDQTSLLCYPQGRTGSYTIPSSVTDIGENAFYECTGLTGALIIPSGVTSIGGGAFYKCAGIVSVTIPDSVTNIGARYYSTSYWTEGAFRQCTALTSVTMPVHLTENFADKFSGYSNLSVVLTGVGGIPDKAFEYCTGLTSITLGDGVTSMGKGVFDGCTALVSMDIGAGLNEVWIPFYNCDNLERITVNPANAICRSSQGILYTTASVVWVPQKASGSITIPEGITRIGDATFEGRTGITSVSIPSSVTSIGERAFGGCTGITGVIYIPSSVTSIEERAFGGCTGITGINVDNSNSRYSSIDGVLFNKEKTLLIQYPAGRTGGYIIPDSVQFIGVRSFEDCADLTSVTIPNYWRPDLPLIDLILPKSGVSTIGAYAFSGCKKLTSVTFTGSHIYDPSYYALKALISYVGFANTDPANWLAVLMDFGGLVDDFGKINHGFHDDAFPEGRSGNGGNNLKTAYLAGGAGTYTRTKEGSDWKKKQQP